METSEKKIPTFVFEDLLFRRRLERNLNDEFERLNRLLAEQVELLQERKALMTEVREAAQGRWEEEETERPRPNSATETGEDADAD
jgi:hypothetical protein